MTQAIDGLKPLVIPDGDSLVVNGRAGESLIHLLNDISARFKLIAGYQEPVIPDPPDPPVWELIEARTVDGDEVFTDLDGYQAIIAELVGVSMASSGIASLRVSTDNGSTFLSSSGDYYSGVNGGGKTNLTEIQSMVSNATSNVNTIFKIEGFSLASPKPVRTSFIINYHIATTAPLNAIKIFGTGGALNGGTIYLSGLPGLGS